MLSNYGKLAYLKVLELEKRFENFQKDLKGSLTDLLTYDLTTPERRTVFTKKFTCKSNSTSTLNVKVDLKTDTEIKIEYQFFIGDTLVKTDFLQGGNGSFSFDYAVAQGKLNFTLKLIAVTSFTISNLYVTLSGKVSYLTEFRRLSYYTHGDVTYITTISGNVLTIYGYSVLEGLHELFILTEIKDASIVGFINGELYVSFIDEQNALKVLMYNVQTFGGLIANLSVSGVTSLCGYGYGDGVEIIFVLTGNVYVGVYVKGEPFTYQAVKRKGVKVTAEASVPGVYIISDAYSSNKLVTSEETYVLDRGGNHHISKIEGGYAITYSDKNSLYYQEVGERVTTPQSAGYADERITLLDGKFLIRVRDLIKISED
jgi:hypothetical protein